MYRPDTAVALPRKVDKSVRRLGRRRPECYNPMFVPPVRCRAGRPRSPIHPAARTRKQENGHIMAKRCEICEKGPVFGRNISHAHNVTPRRFEPNLQRVRALVNGGIRRLRVCTRCLRSGKVVKAA